MQRYLGFNGVLERKIVPLPPALTLTARLLLAVIAGLLGLALVAPFAAVVLGIFDVLLPVEEATRLKVTAKGGWLLRSHHITCRLLP